eukprot:TRINITY_DN306_c0_g1_i7.p1 TRINITY_DN306_c0_g1~~TRINITY_DN306_c0_g1_i7.p1  ORF type:complete len:333 (-),score=-20.33 TRINITY_DN306_c0_g1_i7:152-1084(-)
MYAKYIGYAGRYVLREHSRACQRCTNLCIMSELCSSVSAPCTMGGSAAMYAMRCKFIGYAGSTYQTCIMASRCHHVLTTYAPCLPPMHARAKALLREQCYQPCSSCQAMHTGTAYAQFIRYAPLGNHVLCYVLREHSRACQRCTNLCIMSELCSSVSAPCTMGGSAAMYAMRCKFIGYAGSTYQTCIMGRAPITENSRYYHVCTNPPIMRITYASCIIPGGLRSSTVDAYLDVLLEHAHTMNMRLDSMLSSVLLHRVWCTRLASVGVVLSSARHTGTITNMATYYGSSLQGAINGWSSREGQKGWPKRGC